MWEFSAVNRALPIREGAESIPFIQTSISINPGHSGGSVVNLLGKVVGVTTHIYTDQPGSIGISFAVPSLYADAEELSKKCLYESHVKLRN
jgi:serine protease Do